MTNSDTQIKELLNTLKSVSVNSVSLSEKEAKALIQCITVGEIPLLLCNGAEIKVVMTTENFFVITSRIFRAVKIKAIPMNSVQNVQEKRGILLARITLTADNQKTKLANLHKEASRKIIDFLKSHDNIVILPTKKPGILEVICKVAITALFAFVLKDMLFSSTKSETRNQPQTVQAENSTIVTAGNGKTVIDLNSGQVTQKKSTTVKQWFEGGTLHNATLKQWRKATSANKLATCADFVATAWKDNKLKPHIADINELKYYAQELVTFIDTGTDGIKGIEHYKINEIAALGFVMMNWLKN